MNGTGAPPERVPTLTEVVDLGDDPATTEPMPLSAPAPEANVFSAGAPTPPTAVAAASGLSEQQLIQRVLADVQRQIDLMLEYRLRELLTPIVTRATDAVARETRTELASMLRDVVTRAVAQELARHRGR